MGYTANTQASSPTPPSATVLHLAPAGRTLSVRGSLLRSPGDLYLGNLRPTPPIQHSMGSATGARKGLCVHSDTWATDPGRPLLSAVGASPLGNPVSPIATIFLQRQGPWGHGGRQPPCLRSAAVSNLELVAGDGCLTARPSFLPGCSPIYTHTQHRLGSLQDLPPGVSLPSHPTTHGPSSEPGSNTCLGRVCVCVGGSLQEATYSLGL